MTLPNRATTRADRILNTIERAGNSLPDPFVIFLGLAAFVAVMSALAAGMEARVTLPGSGTEVVVRSLLSAEGVIYILENLIRNFVGFAPLGLVLTVMLGIGLAERVGLLNAVIRRIMLAAPPKLATLITCFCSIMMSIASDAAMILLPPLAALIFKGLGRHPAIGFVAGFACAGAGFTANLLIQGTDVLLAGISTEAASILDPDAVVTPVANWYFNMASVVVLTVVGALVTDRIVAPKFKDHDLGDDIEVDDEPENTGRALRNAGIAALVFIGLLVAAVAWPGSILRNPEGGMLPSPFLSAIVPFILFFFVTVAITFGVTVGAIRSTRDLTERMAASVSDLSGYIVLIFAAAQFISWFTWSNLGTWLAITGADLLIEVNFTGYPLLLAYSCLSAVLEMVITSGSAKWALEAPIFVPLLMQLGYDPGFIQIPYRVADSAFNILSPTNPYVFVALGFLRRYLPEAGLGTLIALMLPYGLCFFGVWQVMILIFYMFNLPVGPGVLPMG